MPKSTEQTADLWYPRNIGTESVTAIRVRLFDVRAARDIVIEYDFDRDGYTITPDNGPDRRPAASVFVPAWDDEGTDE